MNWCFVLKRHVLSCFGVIQRIRGVGCVESGAFMMLKGYYVLVSFSYWFRNGRFCVVFGRMMLYVYLRVVYVCLFVELILW